MVPVRDSDRVDLMDVFDSEVVESEAISQCIEPMVFDDGLDQMDILDQMGIRDDDSGDGSDQMDIPSVCAQPQSQLRN